MKLIENIRLGHESSNTVADRQDDKKFMTIQKLTQAPASRCLEIFQRLERFLMINKKLSIN
jgi:hypothetical protein